jgi:hypothetical protein
VRIDGGRDGPTGAQGGGMRKVLLTAFITLSFAACSKSKFDKAMSEESDWKDKMCACSDKDCVDKVQKDYKEWDKNMKSDFNEDDLKNLSGDQISKAMKLEEEMRTCRHKFDK